MENTSGKPISPSPFIKNKQPNVDQLQEQSNKEQYHTCSMFLTAAFSKRNSGTFDSAILTLILPVDLVFICDFFNV